MTLSPRRNSNQSISTTTTNALSKQPSKINNIWSILPFGIGSTKRTINVLRLEGVIGSSSRLKSGLNLASLNKLIEKAFSDDKLEAVFLVINSPGGSPVQSELIAARIIQLSNQKGIKVFTFIEDVAASGGYWLACAGEKIFASSSSIVGSIGVISSGFGFVEAIEKLGIERRIYTQGKNKSVLDPFTKVKESDLELVSKLQKNIHDNFINFVKSRRGNHITQDDDIIFNGEFWSGKIALDYGLIDGIKSMHDFIEEEYGDDVKIVNVEQKNSFIKKIALSKIAGQDNLVSDVSKELINGVYDKAYHELMLQKFGIK
jgi:signal peptide peptidase SppA